MEQDIHKWKKKKKTTKVQSILDHTLGSIDKMDLQFRVYEFSIIKQFDTHVLAWIEEEARSVKVYKLRVVLDIKTTIKMRQEFWANFHPVSIRSIKLFASTNVLVCAPGLPPCVHPVQGNKPRQLTINHRCLSRHWNDVKHCICVIVHLFLSLACHLTNCTTLPSPFTPSLPLFPQARYRTPRIFLSITNELLPVILISDAPLGIVIGNCDCLAQEKLWLACDTACEHVKSLSRSC